MRRSDFWFPVEIGGEGGISFLLERRKENMGDGRKGCGRGTDKEWNYVGEILASLIT